MQKEYRIISKKNSFNFFACKVVDTEENSYIFLKDIRSTNSFLISFFMRDIHSEKHIEMSIQDNLIILKKSDYYYIREV